MTCLNAPWHVHEELFGEMGNAEDTRYRIPSTVSSSLPLSLHTTPTHAEPLREMNGRGHQSLQQAPGGEKPSGKHIHVPHKDKPPQVVAKRNARERRRVQAVNSAFIRLRKAVPFENNRGKRISKVKTLQYAIDYIQKLQDLLADYNDIQNNQFYYNYYPSPEDQHFASSEITIEGFTDTFDLCY